MFMKYERMYHETEQYMDALEELYISVLKFSNEVNMAFESDIELLKSYDENIKDIYIVEHRLKEKTQILMNQLIILRDNSIKGVPPIDS